MDVAQFDFGDVGGVVVAPAFAGAVTREMLGTGGDVAGFREVIALEAAHHGSRQHTAQVRVFTQGLCDSPPARIAPDIDHRGKRPVDAVGSGLEGGDARTGRDQFRIPTRRLAQRNREDGFEAVNDVPPDQ